MTTNSPHSKTKQYKITVISKKKLSLSEELRKDENKKKDVSEESFI